MYLSNYEIVDYRNCSTIKTDQRYTPLMDETS
ncbi:MAG: hypothetical protein ACJAU2_001641 [Maribacter sp.]|jgi:hypothetical protein